ncbi:hypothetical protein EON81_07105 [bacterium]|nr:MAG: hypothetical protein EON81_07105 [bacterium]
MHLKRFFVGATIALTAAMANAQSELSGYHQYPQYRTMSGLPGSGFAVDPFGVVGIGAISLSTPIAYSIGNGRFVIGAMSTSNGYRPKFTFGDKNGLRGGNGTGQIMYGTALGRYGTLTSSVMVLSGTKDQAYNLHWAPPQREGKVTYAVGVQDLIGDGGASGTFVRGDGDNSRSLYAVATGQVSTETYVSLGYGTRRFDGIFGNASTTVYRNTKGYVEYDTFNWNFGGSYIIPLGRREETISSSLTLNAGLIRGKYLALSANLSF